MDNYWCPMGRNYFCWHFGSMLDKTCNSFLALSGLDAHLLRRRETIFAQDQLQVRMREFMYLR